MLSLVALVARRRRRRRRRCSSSGRTGRPTCDPVAQDRPGPVLLVPGYGGKLSSLTVLAAALRGAGRDVTLVDLPAGGTGDLRQQAKVLDAAATAAIARTQAPSVDVIGYSAGGVVARLWVKDFGGGDLARRVVTLGLAAARHRRRRPRRRPGAQPVPDRLPAAGAGQLAAARPRRRRRDPTAARRSSRSGRRTTSS